MDGQEINMKPSYLNLCTEFYDLTKPEAGPKETVSRFYEKQIHQEKPTLVIAKTRIGRGAPNAQGTPAAHGRPLGKEEVTLAKN